MSEPEVVSSVSVEGGGDPIYVLVEGGRVLLRADHYDDDTLTPEHARHLAHALQRAADMAEPIDREGPRALVRELVRLIDERTERLALLDEAHRRHPTTRSRCDQTWSVTAAGVCRGCGAVHAYEHKPSDPRCRCADCRKEPAPLAAARAYLERYP